MSVTIQVKRGTQAQVLAGTLAIGEIGFATDTKNCFTYDGVTKQLIGRAGVDTLVNRPTFGVAGRLFFASDTGVLFIDTGSAWVTLLPFGTTGGTICEGNDSRLSTPSNATAIQSISKIPISDTDGDLDDWVTPDVVEIDANLLEVQFIPSGYSRTLTPSSASLTQVPSHLNGISVKLAELEARLAAHSI
jgi:hypothetical protein